MIKLGGHVFPKTGENAKIQNCWPCFSERNGLSGSICPPNTFPPLTNPMRSVRPARPFEKRAILIAEAGYWENMLDFAPGGTKKESG